MIIKKEGWILEFVEIKSLPKIIFAHSYQAENYRKQFDISHSILEITYLLEGSIEFAVGEKKITLHKGDVLCALRSAPAMVEAKHPHHHHTVAAKVDWAFSKDPQNLHLPLITPASGNSAKICRIIDDFVHNHLLYKSQPAVGAWKFMELLCAIDRANRKKENSNLLGEALYATRAKEYIQNNIRSNISQASIAKELGIGEAKVKVTLHRLREQLKLRLEACDLL